MRGTTRTLLRVGGLWVLTVLLSCGGGLDRSDEKQAERPQGRPSILLVTLDTTRADHLGLESGSEATPNLDALARRGLYFSAAYSTVPTTLPSHVSMMTGLYPAEHGIRENGRQVGEDQVLLAERLGELGYRRAAFVSGYPLVSKSGLGRGFELYDDDFGPSVVERTAGGTIKEALAYLAREGHGPTFVWVHLYDPHEPYSALGPSNARFAANPYLAEIAWMDSALGKLIEGFESWAGSENFRILVIADHGEGRGDHGETLHGNLLYQETMRVPLIIAGSGIEPGRVTRPVSSRRVFDTVLGWAGATNSRSLLSDWSEPVMGEAMKPFLHYGWQPQVMAVDGDLKVIRSGDVEVYDLSTDPGETKNLQGTVTLSRALREAVRAYPFIPESARQTERTAVSEEDRQRLASLGYVGWEGPAVLREGAPSPREMIHLFADLDRASRFFVRRNYAEAIDSFQRVLKQDPNNLMVALRLAVAHSARGHDEQADRYFARARAIDPSSVDVRHYQAMAYCQRGRWEDAEPLLVSVVAQMPKRLPALQCLSRVRHYQGRFSDAATLLERVAALQEAPGPTLLEVGRLRMFAQDTAGAIRAYEQASSELGSEFGHFLDLGVCYMAEGRFVEARAALERVSINDSRSPMVLFKRAQLSVLLNEPDSAERIRQAYRFADSRVRYLIEHESLFKGIELQ